MTDKPASKRARTLQFQKEMRALMEQAFRPKSPKRFLEEAQALIYRAWEAPSRKLSVELARKALELSADCADAYLILAECEAKTLEEAIALHRQAVVAGRRAVGKKAFKEDVGHFWGILETRPFMRAMDGLAGTLQYAGGEEEAVGIWKEMLRLNPNDNQGVRYRLLALLVEMNRNAEAEELIENYRGDYLSDWAFAGALLAFRREGDTANARKLLAAALKKNPHVPSYLLGKKKLPKLREEYITPGGDSEAISCAEAYLLSWVRTAGAREWLSEASGVPLAKIRGPRATPLFKPAEKKKILDLLSLAAVPEEALNLEALHGLLFGIAITPEVVTPGEWLPLAFGEQMLALDGRKNAEGLLENLLAVHHRLISEHREGTLRFPFNFEKLRAEEMERVRDWAFGLFLALRLRADLWGLQDAELEGTLDRQEGPAWAAAVVSSVGMPEGLNEAADQDDTASEEEEFEIYMSLFEALPEAVATLIAASSEIAGRKHLKSPPELKKIGRNDACPCGSGRKVKKCCGQTAG